MALASGSLISNEALADRARNRMYLQEISSHFAAHEPALIEPGNDRHAAVAMILRRTAGGIEVLFIERSHDPADPWSGQMAFPGGSIEAHDRDACHGARRETLEEVGIDLPSAACVGRLDDVQGRHRTHRAPIIVSGFVFVDERHQATALNHEVAAVVWEPLASFNDSGRSTLVEHPAAPGEQFPGVHVGHSDHQVVWGLTRRFVLSFFEIMGRSSIAALRSGSSTRLAIDREGG